MNICLILVCYALLVIPGYAQSGNAKDTKAAGSSTASSTDTNAIALVKGYADRIQKGMSKEDVEKITGIQGNPKENNALLEQLFHYDYNQSCIEIIYSVDLQNSTFAVLEKRHIIDNMTIAQRNEKRREAFARWVEQRKEIMKKHEARHASTNWFSSLELTNSQVRITLPSAGVHWMLTVTLDKAYRTEYGQQLSLTNGQVITLSDRHVSHEVRAVVEKDRSGIEVKTTEDKRSLGGSITQRTDFIEIKKKKIDADKPSGATTPERRGEK